MISKKYISYLVAISFVVFGLQNGSSQTNIKALQANFDLIVKYVNTNTHGLVIAHKLLELNNQDINKYVDLDGYQLNFYSNRDLPRNIFEDPDQWFYEESPKLLLNKILERERYYPKALWDDIYPILSGMNDISNNINNIRFDIEQFINNNDLNDRSKLYPVYKMLESVETYYEDFYKLRNDLYNILKPIYKKQELNALESAYLKYFDVHQNSVIILSSLRNKKVDNLGNDLQNLISSYGKFKKEMNLIDAPSNFRNNFSELKGSLFSKIEQFINEVKLFKDSPNVPLEYNLYGKYYYYHNSNLLNKFNFYGPGFVSEFNAVLDLYNNPGLYFVEVPHFYQVIYPKNLLEIETFESTSKLVADIPVELKNRTIKSSNPAIITDNPNFEIMLFDHMLQDGDIVSVNFNGDWIFKDISIESKPKKLQITLNEDGKNYLILHAENEGRRPPNTMGVRYITAGVQEEIVLKSDLKSSELIEIKYQP